MKQLMMTVDATLECLQSLSAGHSHEPRSTGTDKQLTERTDTSSSSSPAHDRS